MYLSMAQSTNIKEWDPIAPVERILREVLDNREGFRFNRTGVIDDYLRLYERFRMSTLNDVLLFPEGVLSSREWYEDLFSPEGSLKQMNLDHIGKDFLCMIYLTEVIRESFSINKVKSLYRVLMDRREGNPNNNLNNSLLWTESLVNFLTLHDWDLSIPVRVEGERSILFTDVKYKIKEEDSHPVVWMVETSRFSKLVRRISVSLQNREKIPQLMEWSPERYELTEELIVLSERFVRNTFLFALEIAVNREFRLWDPFRQYGFPSLRQISEYTQIPFSILVDLRRRQADPNEYTGTSLLHRIPVRVADELIQELTERERDRGGLTKLTGETIL